MGNRDKKYNQIQINTISQTNMFNNEIGGKKKKVCSGNTGRKT